MFRRRIHGAASIALLIPALAIAACAPNDAPVDLSLRAPDARPLDYGEERSVDVNARGGWQSSGLILSPDDTYSIRAAGQWTIGPGICGNTDAEGRGVSPLCSVDHLGIGANGSSLIGRITPTGKVFLVGNQKELKPDAEGEFFMRAYDMLPNDNEGAMSVTIRFKDSLLVGDIPDHHDPL